MKHIEANQLGNTNVLPLKLKYIQKMKMLYTTSLILTIARLGQHFINLQRNGSVQRKEKHDGE